MGLHEPFVVSDGYRLFRGGLGSETLRDPNVRRYWRGLAGDEVELLWRWVGGVGTELVELHTDVPLGIIPDTSGMEVDECIERMCCSANPLRVDAVAKVGGRWMVIEVKVNAGYQALGQVLTYGFFAPLAGKELVGAGLAVVTDRVQECIRPVFNRFQVEVIEVGGPVV